MIDVSKLPEIVYATEIVEKEEDKPGMSRFCASDPATTIAHYV